MTTKDYKQTKISLFGMISFFILVAFVMQVAILTYDYICDRTDDTGTIAILILILIVILASFCTLCDYIRRKIMIDRPVGKILDATEKIANGDFYTRINIEHSYDKYNEFDVIAENLNTMAAELSKSEMLKKDFISNVSHEIKTPLSVISSYSAALADPDIDEETRIKYTKTLNSASKRLSDLVSDILKLNKLENQQIRPEFKKINLSEDLADQILAFETAIEDKNISLDLDLGEIYITSAPALLELVWNNLLSNAIKFTEPGGSISVKILETAEGVAVSVADTGCGMSREVGVRIFEKFYQGDTSHSGEGNGLGLALVKRVIDILGGEISVESELGIGSCFTVTLRNIGVL